MLAKSHLTSFHVMLTIPHKKIKDVFDERRRITCFSISPRVITNPFAAEDSKIYIEREQSQFSLSYTECEQIEQS